MPRYLMLLSPSANRVYTAATPQLAAAELSACAPWASAIAATSLAGVDYLGFEAAGLAHLELASLSRHSTSLALFETVDGDLLRAVEVPETHVLDEDLVTIPKYQGKTNEHFTELLLNVTLAQVDPGRKAPLDVLDPLAGRGTTLLTAWRAGHNGFGVETDDKAFEAMAAFLKTWLRRKRLKHSADVTPVRRDGRSLGRRFDATLKLGETVPGAPDLAMTVFTGDTQDSAKLFGKKRFDAIVTDAPYGVVHGSHQPGGPRTRTPEALLREALPVWAGQLRAGGAIGLSWNTLTMPRESLLAMLVTAGLTPLEGQTWAGFAHRVDSSIRRDLVVAVKN